MVSRKVAADPVSNAYVLLREHVVVHRSLVLQNTKLDGDAKGSPECGSSSHKMNVVSTVL